ncbi:hypothetical protein Tco_0506031 [Tanacetum coccineum]
MLRKDMDAIGKKVEETIKEVIHMMVDETTKDNMKKNLPRIAAEGIRLEREKIEDDIASMMKDNEQAHNADLPLWLRLMHKFERPASYVGPCRVDSFVNHHHMKRKSQIRLAQVFKNSKRIFFPWSKDQGTDDDEVPSEEVSPELLAEMTRKE